jgi:Chaperone of endosialidase
MKTRIQSILIVITLLFLGLLPQVQAVSPAPDGCYPNYTTAEGCDALNFLSTGSGNTGIGWRSLFLDSTGNFNTGVGAGTLTLNNGDSNTAVGAAALLLTSGSENTAVGTDALVLDETGSANSAFGNFALSQNTTGNFNTAVGEGALTANATGINNTAVGVFAGAGVATASNVICIGTAGADVSDSCFIGEIFGQSSPSGTAVFVNSDGKLGTTVSSRRFKDDIKPMDTASEAILALKPVTFRYKKEFDPTRIAQFGLVAEEVEKVNSDLVVRDKEGKPHSVRYDQVNAMLLNEFLKEHRAFVEEERKVQQQQKEIDSLKAELKEQRSLIQKVSDEVELNRSTAQVVANNQ